MSEAYGTWQSPISGASIASGVSLRDVQWSSAGDTLVWWENRGKLGVLQAQTGGQAARDLTDRQQNVAGRVGYGGGAFALGDGKVFLLPTDASIVRRWPAALPARLRLSLAAMPRRPSRRTGAG